MPPVKPPAKIERMQACAWADPTRLERCVYRAAEGQRFCARHLPGNQERQEAA